MIGRTVSTILSSTLILTITLNTQLHSTKASNDITSLFDMPHPPPSHSTTTTNLRSSTTTNTQQQQAQSHRQQHKPAPMTKDELLQWRIDQSERIRQRKLNARERIAQMNPDLSTLTPLSKLELQEYYHQAQKKKTIDSSDDENHSWLRQLWGGGSSNSYSSGSVYGNYDDTLLDVSQSYDWWAQGYRMLGGFVDCDVKKGGGGSHDNNKNEGGNECSRWMMWAAYVNPNYQGGGYNEYFGDNNNQDDIYYGYGSQPRSKLDCHDPNTDWLLLGVYRQEFYQFIEQISKHLWAIDSYEYVVALAGLAYMTDENCSKVGSDAYGNYLYAGVMPLQGGSFMMGLYYDEDCLIPDTTSGYTADSFNSRASGMDLGDKYNGNLDDNTLSTLYGYWYNAQEYTLSMVNDIYEQYKYCTLCLDYPTYQDGYFIGDSGTDEGDIINQCWKFHSHDSYTCTTDCIALGDAQHSITLIKYGDQYYGDGWSGGTKSSSGGSGSSSTNNKGYQSGADKVEKLKANAYLTFNGVLFIATFLAFSVARGNASPSSKDSDKKRGLLGRGTKSKDKKSSSSTKTRSTSKGSTSSRRSGSNANGSRTSRDRSKSASRSNAASKNLSIDGSRTRSRSRSRGGVPG